MNGRLVEITTRALGLEVSPAAIAAVAAPEERTLLPFLKTSPGDERAFGAAEPVPQLRFDGLDHITQRGGVPRFPNLKALDAVVNPRTEIVYKLASPWPAEARAIAPFPAAAEEERQLRTLGERFVALPDREPDVDFYNALKQVERLAPVAPQEAKQVIAYLVVHHTRKYAPRPVWIIQTRGIDLAAEGYAAMGHIPEDARNHMRHVVDATTGEWLYSDTAPQPAG